MALCVGQMLAVTIAAGTVYAGEASSLRHGITFEAGFNAPQTTTLDPFRMNATAAEMSGVHKNSRGDLVAFTAAFVTNSFGVVLLSVIFSVLRRTYPYVYSGNVVDGKVPAPPPGMFSWISASWRLDMDEVKNLWGLDQCLLLRFSELALKMLVTLAVPLIFVMGPIHWVFGGDRATDRLSKMGLANVVDGHPWIYWVHAISVWMALVLLQRLLFAAMADFMTLRMQWLREMPEPRATTVLVEGIPREHCTDSKLEAYMNRAFGHSVVATACTVKRTGRLRTYLEQAEAAKQALAEAKAKKDDSGEAPKFEDKQGFVHDSIEYHTKELELMKDKAATERTQILAATARGSVSDCGDDSEEPRSMVVSQLVQKIPRLAETTVNTNTGFVTFKHRRDAEMAIRTTFNSDMTVFRISVPPDPSDVIYSDFQRDPRREHINAFYGYLCILGIFVGYLPVVLFIAMITRLEFVATHVVGLEWIADHNGVVAAWDGLLGGMILSLIASFVPSFLVLIFHAFMKLKAEAWMQQRIQQWFFLFFIVFVLFVTVVGNSLLQTMREVLLDPWSIMSLFASTMPHCTHFYLNYMTVQWPLHFQEMLRMFQLIKFCGFRAMFHDDVAARKSTEPEDQDYYGIGCRSARFSFALVLCIVLGNISPLITLVGILNFIFVRTVFGYLIYYAEIKKPDLGGVFWVTKLESVQQGLFVYIILVSGVLFERAASLWPGIVAASSLAYLSVSYSNFRAKFRWQTLSLEEVSQGLEGHHRKPTRTTYVQPELLPGDS